MKIISLVVGLLCFQASAVFACEPAEIGWTALFKQYDMNNNKKFEWSEFKKIQNFLPYEWPDNPEFKGEDGRRKLFQLMDKNKDEKLDQTELYEVYTYLENPCAGWPWTS